MNSDNHLANTALHIKTPLRQDFELSQQLSGPEHTTNVFYKLENCQPTGSFKLRGIGNLIARKYEEGKAKQIVASSGGNAGAAAAYTANKLGIRAKVYVPETTGQIFIRKLK
jgi:L-serine/L-threonine ammonia-lyase